MGRGLFDDCRKKLKSLNIWKIFFRLKFNLAPADFIYELEYVHNERE